MIKIKRLHPDAVLPTKGSNKAACWDLYALEDVEFKPAEVKLVRTGWAFEPPEGYRFNLYVRSSTPLKKGFILSNGVGIIDADYRGDVMLSLMNVNGNESSDFEHVFYSNKIKKGDKVGQLELVVDNSESLLNQIAQVQELSDTNRGEGGFGSTGNS